MPTSKKLSTSTSKNLSASVKKNAVSKKKPVAAKILPPKPAVEPVIPQAAEEVVAAPVVAVEAPSAPAEVVPAPETPPTVSIPVVQPAAVQAPETVVSPVTQEVSLEAEDSSLSSDWGSFRKEALESKKGKLIPILLTIIVLLLLGGGAFYFWTSPYNFIAKKAAPTPTAVPLVTSSPTPEEIDLSAYVIQVLNGSGVAGEAANAQGYLQGEGFDVPDIGNAPDSNVEDTQIAVKKDVSKAFIKILKEKLGANYGVSSELLTLDENDEADVVVTLGSNINK